MHMIENVACIMDLENVYIEKIPIHIEMLCHVDGSVGKRRQGDNKKIKLLFCDNCMNNCACHFAGAICFLLDAKRDICAQATHIYVTIEKSIEFRNEETNAHNVNFTSLYVYDDSPMERLKKQQKQFR